MEEDYVEQENYLEQMKKRFKVKGQQVGEKMFEYIERLVSLNTSHRLEEIEERLAQMRKEILEKIEKIKEMKIKITQHKQQIRQSVMERDRMKR